MVLALRGLLELLCHPLGDLVELLNSDDQGIERANEGDDLPHIKVQMPRADVGGHWHSPGRIGNIRALNYVFNHHVPCNAAWATARRDRRSS